MLPLYSSFFIYLYLSFQYFPINLRDRDPSFRYIIDYCVKNGAYQNVPLKQVREWHEPDVPANGTPNGQNPATNGQNSATNGKSSTTPPKPSPNAAKVPAKPHTDSSLETSTNQDNEDVFVAASRVLRQHNPEPASSKAASVATPAQEELQVQHKDALLSVLARFFDPAHPASGRDPAALAPLFAQSEVAGYCEELVHNIVTAGTQVGREESARACGVLKVLGEHVTTVPAVLTKMYVLFFFFLFLIFSFSFSFFSLFFSSPSLHCAFINVAFYLF
jgi:hypothetical protein